MIRFNKKIIFGIVMLILIVNMVSIVSAVEDYKISRYDVGGSFNYVLLQYLDSGDIWHTYTAGFGVSVDFVLWSDGSNQYWEGSGESTLNTFKSVLCDDDSTSTVRATHQVTVTCSLEEGCLGVRRNIYDGTDCDGVHSSYDTSKSFEVLTPSDVPSFTEAGFQVYMAGFYFEEKPLSNCKIRMVNGFPYFDHYSIGGFGEHGGSDDYSFYKSFSMDFIFKRGYCETKPNYPMATEDYTCDLHVEKYDGSDPFTHVESIFDSKHTMKSKDSGPYDTCCDNVDDNILDGENPGDRMYQINVGSIEPAYSDTGGGGSCDSISDKFPFQVFTEAQCTSLGCSYNPVFSLGVPLDFGHCTGNTGFDCGDLGSSILGCTSRYDCEIHDGKCMYKTDICKDTGKNICVECSGGGVLTEEHQCGDGMRCCAGECYDPVNEVCCGLSTVGVDCKTKSPRASSGGTGKCVENGGVCISTGTNNLCYDYGGKPDGWDLEASDSYREIASNWALENVNNGESLCSGAKGTWDLEYAESGLSEIIDLDSCVFKRTADGFSGEANFNVGGLKMSGYIGTYWERKKEILYNELWEIQINSGGSRNTGNRGGGGRVPFVKVMESSEADSYEEKTWIAGGPLYRKSLDVGEISFSPQIGTTDFKDLGARGVLGYGGIPGPAPGSDIAFILGFELKPDEEWEATLNFVYNF